MLENDKDKILEILGRTSEKEQMEKLCDKYKEMYDKVSSTWLTRHGNF